MTESFVSVMNAALLLCRWVNRRRTWMSPRTVMAMLASSSAARGALPYPLLSLLLARAGRWGAPTLPWAQ